MSDESKSVVIPGQLRVAREDIALSVDETARTLGVEAQELISWEEGRSEPPVERLWELAELYHRSTDYFLRPLPSLPDRLNFRLSRRQVMADLPLGVREVVVRFDELCRAQSELETLLKKPRTILVERVIGEWRPEELASRERKRLDLGERPIEDLREILTKQGTRIFELPVPEDEVSGLSWWHEEYGPCILINGRDDAGRRSFTLAHEYTHILRSDPPMVCHWRPEKALDTAEERFANKFAAFFLIPASDVETHFLKWVGPPGTPLTVQQLGRLAWRYRVSLEALGRRLEELELLHAGTTDARLAEWEAKGFRRRPRAPRWRRQLGEEFVSLVLDAHSEGYISVGKLAEYFSQDVRKALEVVEQPRRPGVLGDDT